MQGGTGSEQASLACKLMSRDAAILRAFSQSPPLQLRAGRVIGIGAAIAQA